MFAEITVELGSWQFWLPAILLSGIIGYLLGRRMHPAESRKGRILSKQTQQVKKPRTNVFPAPALPASEAALQAKTDPFEKGSFGERRVALRRSGSMVKVAVADEKLESLVPGWVVDRSMGGLGVLLERPLESGLVLHVRPWDGGDMAPWVQVTVRSCQPEEGRWKAGCQFVKTPPWSVMLLFG
jgi:hypothetical protein